MIGSTEADGPDRAVPVPVGISSRRGGAVCSMDNARIRDMLEDVLFDGGRT